MIQTHATAGRRARLPITTIIVLVCTLSAPPVEPGDGRTGGMADPPVTIEILSKHIRLLKEGSLRQITIAPDKSGIITDLAGGGRIHARSLTLIDDGSIRVLADRVELARPVHCAVMGGSAEAECTIQLGEEIRRYPLPLVLSHGRTGIRIVVTERLERYALDSARAEYGGEYEREREAVMALAHLIAARYRFAKRARVHGGADFCDLTHCQVYRGRAAGGIVPADPWMIDAASCPENLFFHSRCGGHTLDTRVFSTGRPPGKAPGVRDCLFQDGTRLCNVTASRWKQSISMGELLALVMPDSTSGPPGMTDTVEYDRERLVIRVHSAGGTIALPPETFRLMINRVKGWNFIKSNNYSIKEVTVDAVRTACFEGEGLGHGVGLCQHGAVSLSRRGYSRYEILEHYYPELVFSPTVEAIHATPYLSYCVFDLQSGIVREAKPGHQFLLRQVPAGSIFKLIVALYLAAERPDIFNEYSNSCPARGGRDPAVPEHCWKRQGHGVLRLRDAIAQSCNLYFASLYNRISEKNFRGFFDRFCRSAGIHAALPHCSGEREWSHMLAGLDFRMTFSVGDYIRILRFLHCGAENLGQGDASGMPVPEEMRLEICRALREACVSGTGGGATRAYGAACNYDLLPEYIRKGAWRDGDAWGKTATVIDGTNRPVSYGVFIGGSGSLGIVAVLRKANGHMTARWARFILDLHSARDTATQTSGR